MAGLGRKTSRMIKSSDEISKIMKAVGYTEQAIQHCMNSFKPGMTEKELANIFKKWADDRGLKVSFYLIQGDKNSAIIHGKPTEHKIRDILLLDLGVIYKGYHGDVTRTYLLNPNRQMKKIYSIVRKAHLQSIKATKIGANCKEVDAIARNIITKSGYKFRHSLGHGIGKQVHEYPKIGMKSNHVFQKGMTFTIEPGIYLRNKFGIRIEDCFVLKNKLHKLSKLKIPNYD
jgi:Xaa-Pro dipeptidase